MIILNLNTGKSICQKTRSILYGSWFHKSKLSIKQALCVVAAHAAGIGRDALMFYAGIHSPTTAADWRSFFHDICDRAVFELRRGKIGGPGMIIEVDESMLFRRKNHVGRLLSAEQTPTWVFGGVCRQTGDAFLVPVIRRDEATLLTAIHDNIEAGSTIMSDCWGGYINVNSLGYQHFRVNHRYNFISPQDTEVHTQTVERMWKSLKDIIPEKTSEDDKWRYLAEYIFKRHIGWYNLTIGERILAILKAITEINFNN